MAGIHEVAQWWPLVRIVLVWSIVLMRYMQEVMGEPPETFLANQQYDKMVLYRLHPCLEISI